METSNLTQDNIEFVNNHLNLTLEEVKSLEAKTTEQSNSDIWFLERKKRLTASHFGSIINRRKGIFPT